MGGRGSLALWLGLLCCCLGVASSRSSKHWVAPFKKACHGKANCNTLKEYVRIRAFSQSNVVWSFKKGRHVLNGAIVPFMNVRNVTLIGSKECEPPNVDNCTIQCRGDQVCMFLFVTSHNITIKNLRFVHQDTLDLNPVNRNTLKQYLPGEKTFCYSHSLGFPLSMAHAHYNNCLHDRSWVFVDTVHVTVSNVNFTGTNNYWAIVRPNGIHQVLNCQFYRLVLVQASKSDPQHFMTIVLRKTERSQSALKFLIANSIFNSKTTYPSFTNKPLTKNISRQSVPMTHPAVHVISDKPLNGWKANITIYESRFRRCCPFQLTAVEDPGLTVTLKAVHANAHLHDGKRQMGTLNGYSLMGSAIRIFLANCHTPTPRTDQMQYSKHQCILRNSARLSNITIMSSTFSKFTSEKGCSFLFTGQIAEGCPKGLRIVLLNNTFTQCYSWKFRSVVYAQQHLVDYHTPQGHETDCDKHRLVIDSNISVHNFKGNFRLNKRCVLFERLPKEKPKYLKRPESDTSECTGTEKCMWQGVYFISGFQHHDRVLFAGNKIYENQAQGLTLDGSVLELDGENDIQGNEDYYGGGIALHGNSQLWIRNGSQLNVSENHALVRGGGIFIHDPCTVVHLDACPCFFQFIGNDGRPLRNTSINAFSASVILHRNTVRRISRARATMIFNSDIDNCALQGLPEISIKKDLFQRVFGTVDPNNITEDEIASIPHSICNCSNIDEALNCTAWEQDPLPSYPGQNLTLYVKLIGDMGISTENVLYLKLEKSRHAKGTKIYVPLILHSTHVLQSGCNKLTIPPLPAKDKNNDWVLQLMVPLLPERNQNIFLFEHIETKTLNCPTAYTLVNEASDYNCACYRLLTQKKVQCLLDVQKFVLPRNYWIGTEEEQEGNSSAKVLLSINCPKVYCATANGRLNVSLNEPDEQCKHGRTGILCGQCPKGKSVKYNSFACTSCTNWGVLLVIPFLITGPLLIALICCLNLTISVGSINGFLLYTNIIAINRDVLTAITGDSTDFTQVLGFAKFTICIYNGMDEFASTLLSYLFPVYLLTLVVVICLLPKCKCVNMHKINRRIGPRITPVLATVILLSYTQLAESVIRSLFYVKLFSTNGTTTTSRLVWKFDGSLEYFDSPKHIILACLALLVLTCFLLPVTVIAIFGDLFRRFSRGPWYMNFLDTFHGAFRFRFGFWIGFRILLRTLFMILKIFLPVDKLFLVTAYTIMTLLFLQILIRPFRGIRVDECVSKRIKEKHFPEPLQRELVHSIDHSFLVNLIAVFVYLPHDVKNMPIVLIVSRVIAYTEFACILVYHMLEYSPVGPFVSDTWFKLRLRYGRWRENRREAALARERHEGNERVPCEEQFDLILRASDCKDYEDSESNDESTYETRNDQLQEGNETMIKLACDEGDVGSRPVGRSPSSELTVPLLRKKAAGST